MTNLYYTTELKYGDTESGRVSYTDVKYSFDEDLRDNVDVVSMIENSKLADFLTFPVAVEKLGCETGTNFDKEDLESHLGLTAMASPTGIERGIEDITKEEFIGKCVHVCSAAEQWSKRCYVAKDGCFIVNLSAIRTLQLLLEYKTALQFYSGTVDLLEGETCEYFGVVEHLMKSMTKQEYNKVANTFHNCYKVVDYHTRLKVKELIDSLHASYISKENKRKANLLKHFEGREKATVRNALPDVSKSPIALYCKMLEVKRLREEFIKAQKLAIEASVYKAWADKRAHIAEQRAREAMEILENYRREELVRQGLSETEAQLKLVEEFTLQAKQRAMGFKEGFEEGFI